MTDRRRARFRRPGPRRRRGGAFILVLSVTMIVTVIGLSSVIASRIRLHTTAREDLAVQTRYAAMSEIELALLRIRKDPGWRHTYQHDTWAPGGAVDGFEGSFKLVDEKDGNLKDDVTEPVRLYGRAARDGVVRIYSMALEPGLHRIALAIDATEGDVEERSTDGVMLLDSSALEFAGSAPATDTVGLRFPNVPIARESPILTAQVQFTAAGTDGGAGTVTIVGEEADDAAVFTAAAFDVTGRPKTWASVAWSPSAWTTVGVAASDARSADIASILQEIVDRPGWSAGNGLVLIMSGAGTRSAVAYDGYEAGAPVLHVEWDPGGDVHPVPGTWQREVLE
jgi:hypothetical protein